MNEKFAKLNLLDSKSINDVRRYSTHYPSNDERDAYVTEYMGHEDIANAHKWPHEHFNYSINDYGFRGGEYPKELDLNSSFLSSIELNNSFNTKLSEVKIVDNILRLGEY